MGAEHPLIFFSGFLSPEVSTELVLLGKREAVCFVSYLLKESSKILCIGKRGGGISGFKAGVGKI